MSRSIWAWAFGVPLGLAAGMFVACATTGGVTPESTVTYASVHQLCVQEAQTRAEADSCREHVRQAFCGDGGVWAGQPVKCRDPLADGGK